uniref:MarR family winged helix-turn-helix transcriptional regulator n=1 Tax=Roseivirga sp. TaxID=1964215 RepID=UPI004055EA38
MMGFDKALFHLNSNLGYNLYRTYLLFHRELIRALKGYSVTPEQWQVLIILWNHGSVTPTEISGVTLQDLPSISRMLVRMERNGWIEKEGNEADGRSFRIKLTQRGVESKQEMMLDLEKHFAAFLKGVPAQTNYNIKQELVKLRTMLVDYTPK